MDLSTWNQVGRRKNERVCQAFEEIIDRDGDTEEDFEADERSEELADEVLKAVVALNEAGNWQQAREQFDPAFLPFIPHMEQTEQGFTQVAMLGADAFLLRRGDDTQDGPVVHIDGDAVETLPGALGFGLSRNRKWLVLATESGLAVGDGLNKQGEVVLAWPNDAIRPSTLGVSDDGKTIVISSDEAGVWLARDGRWTQLMPREGVGDDDEPDMVHAAVSPDGRYAAYGWQDAAGHFVDDVSGDTPKQFGVVGTVSDTPYHVLFTDDSSHLMSNTRYMQSGTTVCVALDAIRGCEEYDELPDDTPHTDEFLRAYGMVVFPGELVAGTEEVAWIGGAGWSHAAPLSGGKPVFTQLLGSRLNAFDYDPVSKRVAAASESSVLHVLDPSVVAEPGRERGYNPRRELYRWIFWDSLKAPIRW